MSPTTMLIFFSTFWLGFAPTRVGVLPLCPCEGFGTLPIRTRWSPFATVAAI